MYLRWKWSGLCRSIPRYGIALWWEFPIPIGEAIAAAVVPNPGLSVNGMELAEFCKKKLPSFKKPRYLALMEKLPVNNIGKIAKPVLREQAEQLFAPIFTE